MTGLTNFAGGLNGTSFGNYWFTTWQAYDDTFWSAGKHSIKTGFAFQRICSDFLLAANPNGVFRFDTLPDFLVNRPSSLQVQDGNLTPRALRQNVFGVYVEDDYRPTGNLGLNLGLRYEPASVPTELSGKLANLRTLGSTQIYSGDPLFRNPTLLNLAPRVGLAWDPFRTGRTAVRAGFGIFDVLPLTYQFNLMQVSAAPFQTTASSSSLPPGSFLSGAASLVQLGSNQRTSFIEFEPKRNYVMQWNTSVEQEVLRGLTVTAGVVGTRGVHNAMRTTDANGVIPSTTRDGLVWPCAGEVIDGVCSRPGGGARFNPGPVRSMARCGMAARATTPCCSRPDVAWRVAGTRSSRSRGHAARTPAHRSNRRPFLNSVSGQFLFAPLRALSDFHVGRTLVDGRVGHAFRPWPPLGRLAGCRHSERQRQHAIYAVDLRRRVGTGEPEPVRHAKSPRSARVRHCGQPRRSVAVTSS